MQGKGIVRFFLIMMAIVTIYQFVLVVPTQRVEGKAAAYAKSIAGTDVGSAFNEAKSKYLDSMSSENCFSIPLLRDFTYQDLKASQLKMGLDLEGGMSVVMQVNLKEFLFNLSNESSDETFTQALKNAEARLTTSQSDYITLFADEWRKIANGKKLADIFVLNEKMREEGEGREAINSSSSDGQVATRIRAEAKENVDLTFKLLKERIDKLGVAQPNVSLDEGRDLILVELPGISNPESARRLLQAAAKLEFWDVWRMGKIQAALVSANEALKKVEGAAPVVEETKSEFTLDTLYNFTDELGNIDSTRFTIDTLSTAGEDAANITQGPLFSKLSLFGDPNSATLGLVDKNQREAVMNMLNRKEIKAQFPPNLKFALSKDPFKPFNQTDENASDFEENQYELYAIKLQPNSNKPPLDGSAITDASPGQDQNGRVVVNLKMNNIGAQKWGQMTTAAANDQQRQVAVVLDDEVVSAPSVRVPILTGGTEISGNFDVAEARDLANILQVGKLPVTTSIIQENIVGPYLGAENIRNSRNALLFGFGLVILFMILYYAGGGVVSVIALLANLFFIFGTLASLGTVLTVPGVAGIVLTIGMAVDANVIIYERIREELRAGKSVLASIRDGFQQSYSAIIDANVTTILTAIVLAYFGLGPIKGFATVLIIGVICSLFTAVLVGRLIIEWWMGKEGRSMNFWTGFSQNVLADVNIDWMGMRKTAFMISGAAILISLGAIFTKGFDLGVDFSGGYSYTVEFDQSVSGDQVRDALTASLGEGTVVKAVDTENTFSITTKYLINEQGEDVADKVIGKLHEGVNSLMGGNVALNAFKDASGTGTHIIAANKVGPTIADDIKDSSFQSAFFALLLIFLYLFIRFNRWEFSLGAVLALFHDVIITLGLFALLWGVVPFSMEIDQAFIAAILTVIGYSVNDTVIVFDRIREFINNYTGKTKEEVFNLAINNTLSRTLITSGTTLLVVLTLFLFGGSSIKGFAFALLIGVIVGTYSSIFVASASVVSIIKEIRAKDVKKAKKGTFTRAGA